jgi:hypothetical protein
MSARDSATNSQSTLQSRFHTHASGWFGLVIGGMISLLGLIPALRLNQGASLAEQDRGAMIYVFQRLPHHLVPSRFATDRWLAFAVMMIITLALVCLARRFYATDMSVQIPKNLEPASNGDGRLLATRLHAYAMLVRFAVVFSILASIGVLIDFSLSSWATNWSASLLRYYWFRWNDVIWPTLFVVTLMLVIEKKNEKTGPMLAWTRYIGWALLVVPSLWVIGGEYVKNYSDSISPADNAALLLRGESRVTRLQIHRDWLDMCAFIRSNTPEDSLFLSPRFQQTFKWNAARAEVVCWKDSPQDASGLIEWESRMLAIFPSDSNGYGMPWSDSLLSKLQKTYDFDYVLIDRRIQKTPPVLEFIHSNSTYALFRTIKL